MADLHDAGIERIVVVTRSDDEALLAKLKTEDRFDVEVVKEGGDPSGTLGAVKEINRYLGEEPHILSTCDVICPPGAIKKLITAAECADPASDVLLLLVSDFVHDDTPIWVHMDADGVVTKMGKGIEAASHVFANVRVVQPSLRDWLIRLPLNDVSRDTQMMAALVERAPRSVRSVVVGDVFDVDSWEDVQIAERRFGSENIGPTLPTER